MSGHSAEKDARCPEPWCAYPMPHGHPVETLSAAPPRPTFTEVLNDNEASLIQSAEDRPDLHMPINIARVDLLLAVARAYLGEDA